MKLKKKKLIWLNFITRGIYYIVIWWYDMINWTNGEHLVQSQNINISSVFTFYNIEKFRDSHVFAQINKKYSPWCLK